MHQIPRTPVRKHRHALCLFVLLAFVPMAVQAVTSLVYDAEPNNAPHQAVAFSVPDDNDVARILGELEGQDQDAYRLVVDEDQAGRRFHLRLTGRAGALTKLDVLDFTEIADGRGRIPETLTQSPVNLLTINARDGGRAVQVDSMLLPAGVYVLGVSHSGGSGAYTVELLEGDSSGVRVLDDSNTEDDPQRISPNGRQVVHTQGESWFEFDLDADEAAIPYDFEYQSALGIPSTAELFGPDGTSLLTLEHAGGEPIRRPGLMLAEGVYRIRTEQDQAGVQWLALPRGAPDINDGMEREPNDRVPMTVPFGETIRGRFDEGDTDWLRFQVDEQNAANRWDLVVRGGPESGIEICLQRPAMRIQDCTRGGPEGTRQHSLGLAPGEYTVRLSDRGPDGADWTLEWEDRGPLRPGEESEPNDREGDASPLHDRGFGRGRFDGGREIDYWRFNVTGEPQLWRIQKQGEDIHDLSLKRIGGELLATERAGNATRVRLENQFLLPGEYLIMASGDDSDYTLRIQPLGPPPPGMELEPNDDVSDARNMRFGQEYFGLLAEEGDEDYYRFTLLGQEQVRILVQPPADGRIRTRLGLGDEAQSFLEFQREGELGSATEWRGFLPPGDYSIQLSPFDVSDAEYRLTLFREDALDAITDREPNDWIDAAAPFPSSGVLEGNVGTVRASQDWYVLPEVDAPTSIELPELSGIRYELVERASNQDVDLTHDREAAVYRAELAPEVAYRLQVRGSGEYRVDLAGLLDGPVPTGLNVQVSLQLPDAEVQAFSPWLQRIEGSVEITNPDAEPLELDLIAGLTDLRWSVEGLPGSLTLGAGETRRLPITILVAPDAVVEPDVQLSVHARSGGASSGATGLLRTSLDAVPVAPAFRWAVPEPLRGSFNAAASRHGAELVSSPNIPDNKLDDFVPLFDGLARYGRWTETQMRTSRNGVHEHQQPTVRLAGDAPVPVQGFLLNPTGTMHPRQMLREFEVALSMDGETFETVVRGELAPLAAEQAFLLDEPVPARFARLIPINGAMGETGSLQQLKLGEFKVVAASDWRPPQAPFNLADPVNGGHLVWSEPWIRGSAFSHGVLIDDDEAPSPRMRGAAGATVVLGFDQARAARIARAVIEPMPAETSAGTPVESVRMQVAVDSPLGPWVPVGESLELDSAPVEIALDAPVWARYVRFDFTLPEGAASVRYPDRIAVFEADGSSALGEWGHLSHVGPMEAADPPQPPALTGEPANRSRVTALSLMPANPLPGRALLDAYSSWYRVSSTGTENRLELTMRGRPTLEGAPRLVDAAGENVALYPLENSGTEASWEAWVEPGADYWLEVFEPPRSVIFSWDTSGSVAAWLPTISSALMTYAETIKPGRDEVNLLPFGRRAPLLEDWQGHPYPLMRMLAANPQETSSSDAEGTLAAGAREMIGRPGKKAILLLTDAATSTDSTLWPSMHEGRPQVFSMKLTSEGSFGGNPQHEVDLMQDWAQVRGGYFEYITGYGSLARGFDRAVAWLKRPVDFEVEVAFETVEDPSPATIAVSAGEAGVTPEARGAVEIILDASGSMLKRMGGERRIEIAKAAIRDTVQDFLPDGIPLALRVYGHREAGSCRTDLEVPLEPLDKPTFLTTIEGIQAINLARTPIADSLAAVASDLGDAEGRRLVVLLTDGEETCEGDPAAAIEALGEQGVDVRVNIVGFAIDDETLKDEFRSWAKLGGGQYLDAGEAEALGGALEQSLRIPFEVIDASGDVVATGFVGEDPVEVPAGGYSIRIRAAQDRWIRDVQLAPGDERVIGFES
jgi:hypothetical protein